MFYLLKKASKYNIKNIDAHCNTILFSKATLENINITDIIDGNYEERIYPE